MASYATISPSSNEPALTGNMPHMSGGRRRHHQKPGTYAGSASWASSVINILNTILGAGVLAMPHALSNMGIVLGVLVIVWSGLMSGFGLYLQTRCAQYLDRGTASFFALSQITYPNAAVIFDTAIAVKCFGVAVSYLIIIGDLMPGVVQGFGEVEETSFLVNRQFWITVFMLVVIPLSFLRRLDSLKYTSVIALISIAYLIVLVVFHFASGDTIPARGPVHWVKWQGFVPTLASFPVVVFAYTCHQNMFSVLNEIADNSPARTTGVVFASIGSAASVYVLVAITGYLSFGENILGNIVAQYSLSIASTIGRAAIVVLVMFSYPLQIHPCRASVDSIIRWRPIQTRNPEMTPASGSPSRAGLLAGPVKVPIRSKTEEMSDWRFALISTIIIILSYITAMLVSGLDKVLAYVGSTGSTSISFILPGIFYYKISAPDSPHTQRLLKDDDEDEEDMDSDAGTTITPESATTSWRDAFSAKHRTRQWRRVLLRRLSLALAIYGFVVMIVSLVTNTFFMVAH